MGFRDDIKQVVGAGQRAASEAVRTAASSVDAWATERADNRRMSDIDERLYKAAMKDKGAVEREDHSPEGEPKAIAFDPFDIVSLMGYREKPSELTFTAIAGIANGVPVITDICKVRATQVQTFCQRPEDRHAPGFRVRLKDRKAEVTPEVEERCHELEKVLLHCGYIDDNAPHDAMSLRDFAGMFIKDSLTYDQATFEVVPDRKGDPSYFTIVDPATIRLLDPVSYETLDDPFAVQVMQGMIVTDFTGHELAFCVRNPRSGIKTYGYGQSEIETLVREITGFLWGIEYNRRFFSQGSATKGILNLKGTIPDKHMAAFRRQWYAQVAGVSNSWRTPIMNAEDVQWISMQMNSRDMEMSAWMDFLIKVVCARFLIAPEEVNFSYGNTGQSSAMGNVSTEEKLQASKDLGLRPLVQFFFDSLNKHFLSRIDPLYEAVPVNLDSRGSDGETDLLQKQQKLFLTVNEAREQVGLEALEEKLGDVILDPTWLQWAQSQDMGDEDDDGYEGEEDGEYDAEGADDSDDSDDSDGGDDSDDGSLGEITGPDGKVYGSEETEEEVPDNVAKSGAAGIQSNRVLGHSNNKLVRFYEVDIDTGV